MSGPTVIAPSMRDADREWPTVSVVVPMYNEEAAIEQCVASLQRQDYPAERLEIVVVDGRSEDRSVAVVREAAARKPRPAIRIVENPRRITAAGLNLGIEASSGSIIVRLDAHAEAPTDYVRRNVEVLHASGADYVGGRPTNLGAGYWGGAIAAAMSSRFGVGSPFRHSDRAGDVDTVAFGAFRRETYDRVGRFDEDLVYSEDNEFTHRVRALGGRVYFDPEIRTVYRSRPSLGALFRQYFRYGWGRMRHALRDRSGLSVRHVAPMAFVPSLVLLAAAAPASRLARQAFVVIVATYVACALFSSIRIAARSAWRYLPALPVVFACLHVAYGVGQWKAVADRAAGRVAAAERSA